MPGMHREITYKTYKTYNNIQLSNIFAPGE